MVWQKLLPVCATGMSFPPQIVMNDRRKGPFDVFTGEASLYYNDFFKYGRLNGTFYESKSYGNCYANGTCDGAFEILQTGRADFSIFSSTLDFPPEFEITANDPVVVGPMLNELHVQFMSLPYEPSYKLNSDILTTFEETSWIFYALQVLLFLLAYILLNISSKLKVNYLRIIGKRRERITIIQLYAMYLRQLGKSFKRPHRIISLTMVIVHTALTIAIISGSVKSYMVSEYPAKYYSSLKDLLDRVETNRNGKNATIIMMSDLITDSRLVKIKGSQWERLGKRAVRRTRMHLPIIGASLESGGVIVALTTINLIVRGLYCPKHLETDRLIRESQTLFQAHAYLVMKPNISLELKNRLWKFSQVVFESGRYQYYNNRKVAVEASAILNNDGLALYRCLLTQSMMKWPSASSNSFSYSHFERLFAFLFYFYALTFVCYAGELIAEGVKNSPLKSKIGR